RRPELSVEILDVGCRHGCHEPSVQRLYESRLRTCARTYDGPACEGYDYQEVLRIDRDYRKLVETTCLTCVIDVVGSEDAISEVDPSGRVYGGVNVGLI